MPHFGPTPPEPLGTGAEAVPGGAESVPGGAEAVPGAGGSTVGEGGGGAAPIEMVVIPRGEATFQASPKPARRIGLKRKL